MTDISRDVLQHYGIKRRSGRYPWGSGEDPYQHGGDFLTRVEALKKEGWTETADNIRKQFGMSTTDFRTEVSLCKAERRQAKVETAERLRDKEGLSTSEIGRRMGLNESSVRSLLEGKSKDKMLEAKNTAEFLKKRLAESEHGMVDIGPGVEHHLDITRTRFAYLKKDLTRLYICYRRKVMETLVDVLTRSTTRARQPHNVCYVTQQKNIKIFSI